MSPVFSLLRSLVLSDSPKSSARSRHRREARRRFAPRRLHIEALEDRTLPTAVALPSNAVSWWSANSTANDALGLNNATLSNVTYTTGEVGKAFSFNGLNGWAALGDPSSLAFTQSFTIEGWIKANGLTGGIIMFRGDDRPGLDPYQLQIANGDLVFSVNGYPTGNTPIEAPIPTGQFVHVAATLDDATGAMILYENGAVVAQATTTVRPFGALDPTQQPGVGIGNSNAPNSNVPFNGLIDELTVYNRALTAGEVLGIYKAGSSGKVISPIAVSYPSIVNGSGPVTFTITRTNTSGALTVNWTTADDTARAGTNYVAASGTVTFADGQASQTVTVTTLNDTTPEPNVDFELIATPSGGTSVMGLATILTNATNISVSSASAVEGGNSLKFLDHFIDAGSGVLSVAKGSAFGPDGNLYVASHNTNAILRYDPTGEFLNAFVPAGSGGLNGPNDLAFAPDGSLYVLSAGNEELLHYDASGAFLGVVASGLSMPIGLTCGPDGNMYITEQSANDVLQYNTNSAILSTFITAGSGGLSQADKAVFGPDGNLYVTSQGTGQVLRYNGQTGAFIDVFATTGSTPGPIWLSFGTDGYLYTTVRTAATGSNVSIERFNASTGAIVDSFALGRDGWSFTLGPGNLIYVSSNSDNNNGGFIDRIGPSSIAAFTVSLAWPSATTTTVSYTTADGTALAGTHYTAASGRLTFAPGETSKGILVPTLDDGAADPTRYFTANLPTATGGAITSGQGTGTILDDTKFYVVNDGGNDQTYQYATSGAALGNNALGSGDTAPRGVATTAAGTTEWVVDANRNVYVYNTGGVLLGSWSPAGLSSSAQLNGIATNGTDIWLLDNYSHTVYDYAGAAARLSGSQSAVSTFNLATAKKGNPANNNGKGIVTDGTSFWVVDGSALKVFKYTLSGSLLGNWAIDPADTHPTGITINPSNVSDIWIVDSGTLKVYDYAAAASRTSGSQNASATFALAAGDTNPQGIADPPPADVLLTPTVAAPIPAWSAGPIAITGAPSVASRDAAFMQLLPQSQQGPGEPAVGLPAGGALSPHRDGLTPTSDRFGGLKTLDSLTPLTAGSSQAGRDSAWADDGSQVSWAATDCLFAGLADGTATEP
jgi:sugar lactone lactonase YvrE